MFFFLFSFVLLWVSWDCDHSPPHPGKTSKNFIIQRFSHKSRISQRILKILTCTAKHIFSPVFNGARLFVIFRQEEIHHFGRNLTSKQAHHCPTHEVDPLGKFSPRTCRKILVEKYPILPGGGQEMNFLGIWLPSPWFRGAGGFPWPFS